MGGEGDSYMQTLTCCATTDKTSSSMRLNSSKQAHAPQDAKPLKNCEYGSGLDQRNNCGFPLSDGWAGQLEFQNFNLHLKRALPFPSAGSPNHPNNWRPHTESPALWPDPGRQIALLVITLQHYDVCDALAVTRPHPLNTRLPSRHRRRVERL